MHTRFSLNYLVLLFSLLSVDASTILQRLSLSPLDPFYIVNNEKDIYLVGQVDGKYVQTGPPIEESTPKGKFIVINQYSEEDNTVTSQHLSSDGDVSISPSSGVTMSNGELHLCGRSEKHVYPIEKESDAIDDHEVFYAASLSGPIVRAKGEQCMGITTNSLGHKFIIVLERFYSDSSKDLASSENSASSKKLVLYVLKNIDDPLILDAEKSIELFKIHDASIKVLSVKVEDNNLFKMLFSFVEEEDGKIEMKTLIKQMDVYLKTEYNFTMTLDEESPEYDITQNVDPLIIDRPLTAKTNDHLYFINHYTTTLFDFKLYFLSLESFPITGFCPLNEPTPPKETIPPASEDSQPNKEPISVKITITPVSNDSTPLYNEPTTVTNDIPPYNEPTSANGDITPVPDNITPVLENITPVLENITPVPDDSDETTKAIEVEGNSSYLNSWAMFGLVFLVLMAFSYMIWRYFHQSGFGVLGTLFRSLKNKMFKGVATEPPGNHKEDFKNAREFYL